MPKYKIGYVYEFEEGNYQYLGKLNIPNSIEYTLSNESIIERLSEYRMLTYNVIERTSEEVFIEYDIDIKRPVYNKDPYNFTTRVRIVPSQFIPTKELGLFPYIGTKKILEKYKVGSVAIINDPTTQNTFMDYTSFNNFMRGINIAEETFKVDVGFFTGTGGHTNMPLYIGGNEWNQQN